MTQLATIVVWNCMEYPNGSYIGHMECPIGHSIGPISAQYRVLTLYPRIQTTIIIMVFTKEPLCY